MAKKKPSRQDKPPQTDNQPLSSMDDDASKKLETLKALNNRLIKDAADRRQLVDSLVRSKESLESALSLSESEKGRLQAEFTQLHDLTAQLELERDLVSLFVAEHVSQQAKVIQKERDEFWTAKMEIEGNFRSLESEMKGVLREKSETEKIRREKESVIELLEQKVSALFIEIGNEREGSDQLRQERDVLCAGIRAQVEESNELRVKLVEADKRGKEIEEELQKLKMGYSGLVEEKGESEKSMEYLTREKDSIARSLVDSNRVIETLKIEIEGLGREKEGIEKERNVAVMEKNELESMLAVQNDKLKGLLEEERMLHLKVVDLEKRCVEGVEKEKKLGMEIDALLEKNKDQETSFGILVEENSVVKRELDEALKELEVQKQKMNETVRKKTEIEEVKARREGEIVQIQRELNIAKYEKLCLEDHCREQTEKNGMLQFEMIKYKDETNQVTVERDEARRGFDVEKKNSKILREKILALEKNIEENNKAIASLKAEIQNEFEVKKGLEGRGVLLANEIATLENRLSLARKEADEMQANMELADTNLEFLLNMLRKTTALMVRLSGDQNGVKEDNVSTQKVGELVKPYVAELEAIKKAFKNKQAKVEDMKRQLELLHGSVAEARKGKNFWTLVSSVLTVFAAASVAYVARAR
ncbi:uncharacterized protein LOC127804280 [Diospyros lotus]|uniref:uncharacterized protein LOC127804280 n=1 Tax=Diospyros lotus TaxID=55363 RepID=UPI002255B51E|nr:uncharacterized protein LOC127804280 [Diospyros lotus]